MVATKKGKVILLNPPPDYNREVYKDFDISMGVGAPLGLLLLATVLEREGIRTQIIDGQICDCFNELKVVFEEEEIICIGLSVMSSQFINAKELSKLAKSIKPEVPLIWGGFHPTIFSHQSINNNFIDYLIVGEGDKALLQLCKYLLGELRIEEVGNIVYQKDNQVIKNNINGLSTFDEIPTLNWELIDDIEVYVRKFNSLKQKTRQISILSGLGCNFKCSFCHNAISNKKHRTRKAIDIFNELNYLYKKYNIHEFGLVDENFFADKKRLVELIELLSNSRIRFKWSANLRANYVCDKYLDKRMLKRVADSGGYYFGVGAESGDQSILKKINKGIEVKHILNMAEMTKDVDIAFTYSFIAGIPGESCEMTFKTLHLIERIKEINPKSLIIGPQIFRPYPGSPLYLEALKMGLKEPDDWNQADHFLKVLSRFKRIDIKDIPWHDEPVKFKYMMLSFYLLQLNRRSNVIVNTMINIFKVVSRFRLRTGFYLFLFEKPVLDFINNRLT